MWRFGLRTRTAASYVLVTVAAVLIVEGILLGFVISTASGSDLNGRLQSQADKDAKIMSATMTTMYTRWPQIDQATLLLTAMKASSSDTGFGGSARGGAQDVPLTITKSEVVDVPVEVLIDSSGRIITSTAYGSYPPGSQLKVGLPSGIQGTGGKGMTPAGFAVYWISPILAPTAYILPAVKGTRSRVDPIAPKQHPQATQGVKGLKDSSMEKSGTTSPGADLGQGTPVKETPQPAGESSPAGKGLQTVGYIFVQAPTDLQSTTSLKDSVLPLLAPGALVLALVVPVGVVFGMLSTRRLISRISRLAEVTTAVAKGDFEPRVTVSGGDEVSRLEDGFNRMTEQLGAAVEKDRLSARADARQAERSRIARELHDSISQDLFSLSLLAAGMRRAAPETLRHEAETMERTAARTMREMQALLLELRPVALENAGLIPALEELCLAYEARLGITVRTTLDDVPLAPPAEHAVLRLTQEALGNAIKHAQPEVIDVRLRRVGQEIEIRIADDGPGFDPSCAPLSHGMGLRLMRERVEELGGRFSLESEPGGGTIVTASLPVAPGAGIPAQEASCSLEAAT
ncbi:MAG: Histidine kinase [Sphaerisporangium sp.]|nr:Histidine kinase [Sphaerisporangium sp.]